MCRRCGLDGMARDVRTPHGDARDLETPLLGTGNLANVLAATAVALELGVPLDDIAATAATLRPGGASRRGAAAARRRHAHRRLLQLEPVGADARARDDWRARPAARRRSRCSARCSSSASTPSALHAECGRAAAAAGLDLLVAVGGAPAEALADAAVARRHAARRRCTHVAEQRRGRRPRSLEMVRPGDLVLVKGSRGIRTDLVVDRLKAEFA